MDPLWTEIAKQFPALGVLVYLVMTFLKHIRETTNDFKSTIEEINVNLNDQHNLFRERTERALDNNTTALARNTLMLEQVNQAAQNGRLCENFRAISGKMKQ